MYHLRGAGDGAAIQAVACDLAWIAVRSYRSGPYAAESDLRQAADLYPGHAGIGWLLRLLAQWGHLLTGHPTAGDLAATLASRAHDAPAPIDPGHWRPCSRPATWLLSGACRPPSLAWPASWKATPTRSTAWRSPRTGACWPAAAATGRCGCGTRPPASPPPPCDGHDGAVTRRGVLPGRAAAGQRRRRRDGAAVGPGHRPARRHPRRPRRRGLRRGVLPGRAPAGQRRQRRDGAAVGPGHRPARRHPRRPRRRGQRRGVLPGRAAAGQRRRRRDGAAVGPGHRPARRHPATATTARSAAWRSPRTGSLLASAGGDGTVRLWDPATGQPAATLDGHDGGVSGVAFSPDGHLLASAGGDGTVRLWDPATGQPAATLEGHAGGVNGVAFSPDGHLLASGGNDGTVRLWDPATGQPAATLARPRRRGQRRGVLPGRAPAGQRRRRRDGAAVGPGHRPARRHPGGHAGAVAAWRSPRTGACWPAPAATGRCGCGTRPPASPPPP